ncbi:hypothetical protein N7533_002101 [Penicillium manginii]|uniref:uncharacterized protein n=1 Tax=Penicillium manginii TaxID=203109 RepID=UPI002547A9DB|nr:uncharacterized protein N7533_002101 [Penicillium manginii]KAJ5763420.1 hypothetical protein N7533_002101 [Penicillium manginii]
MVAEVLGKPWTTEVVLSTLSKADVVVAGVIKDNLERSLEGCDRAAVVLVNTHSVEDGSAPDDALSERCDYEFLYSRTPFLRRDLTRFLSLILGQTRPHEDLRTKTRTNFISTTFPDVHAALPNLDILSVGSDAVEIRVDLLVEPECEGKVPSLKYVGQQLMLLRQHTELPIIFTTRCTKENGKFPMDDPTLFFKYLRRAIQWGVEYVDVELWLPEEIRRALAELKGNSIIMSAFHDFSGTWKWTSPSAVEIFNESAKYGDIVKMIAMVSTIEENYELEYFRSTIKSRGAGHPLLSAVNMGQMGQLSRALNTVFSPITHPLLPMIAAPGQLTAAEINEALHIMGQLPRRDLYTIGSFRQTPQSMFMEKCMNELGLPHSFTCIDRGPKGSMESVLLHPQFGGASLNPPGLSLNIIHPIHQRRGPRNRPHRHNRRNIQSKLLIPIPASRPPVLKPNGLPLHPHNNLYRRKRRLEGHPRYTNARLRPFSLQEPRRDNPLRKRVRRLGHDLRPAQSQASGQSTPLGSRRMVH